MYITCVSDKAIGNIAGSLRMGEKLVVHTSGSMNIDVLSHSSENYGVIYPVQTFTSGHPKNFQGVPLCIEGKSKENEILLTDFARKLSRNIHVLDSVQRKAVHLSAVFASNFSNFMYVIAEDLLMEKGIDPKILTKVILQTASNARFESVFKLQTGPAVREDQGIMKAHLAMLKTHPDYKKMYELISVMIIKKKNLKDEL